MAGAGAGTRAEGRATHGKTTLEVTISGCPRAACARSCRLGASTSAQGRARGWQLLDAEEGTLRGEARSAAKLVAVGHRPL